MTPREFWMFVALKHQWVAEAERCQIPALQEKLREHAAQLSACVSEAVQAEDILGACLAFTPLACKRCLATTRWIGSEEKLVQCVLAAGHEGPHTP